MNLQLRSLTLLVAVLLLCCFAVTGQVTTAEIVGTVTDATGGLIAGANVTIRNAGTDATRTMQSNESGNYAFTFLPVGTYSVTIENAGLKTFTMSNLTLAAGDRSRVDARMEPGDVHQSIVVTATAESALQTDSSTVGGLVTTKAVQDLPINGRNIVKLAQLIPGANEGTTNALSSGTRPDDRRQTSAISVHGQTDMFNNYMIDGMDNNERLVGTMGVKPSIDALEEVKIQTTLFPADVGRVASGVVNMITKSGTNGYHGTVFEFLRNDLFDAKDFFNVPQSGNPLAGKKPKYRQNQFGGSIGGPIVRNKLFFFGDYEGLRIVQGQTGTATVPTPCELGRSGCNGITQIGNFSDMLGIRAIYDPQSSPLQPFANNVIPLTRINNVGKNYASLFPATNSCSTTSLICTFVNNPVRTQQADIFDTRVDDHIGDSDILFGRYSFNNTHTFTPGLLPAVNAGNVSVLPGGAPTGVSFQGPADQRYQNAAMNYTHIFRANLLMQLTVSYSRAKTISMPLDYGQNVSSAFGLGGVNVSPQTSGLSPVAFNDGGYVGLGDAAWLPLVDFDNTFQYAGAVNWTKGAHNLKMGGTIIRRRADNYQSQYGKGLFSFSSQQTNSTLGGSGGSGGNSFASLLLGNPVQEQRVLALLTQQYRMWEDSAYIQDDWRIRPWLTLNLGLRWDLYTPYTEKYSKLSNFDPLNASMLAGANVLQAGQNGISDTAGIRTEWNDFQPRVGFSAMLGHGTVLRGGFGMVYSPNNIASPASLKNQPFVNVFMLNAPLGQVGAKLPVLGDTLPSAAGSNVCLSTACGATAVSSVTAAEQTDFHNSKVYMTNVTLEKEFAGNVVTVGYIGQFLRHGAKLYPNIDVPTPPLEAGGCGQTTTITLPSPCQPFYNQAPLISFIQYLTSDGVNNYNGLEATIQRRYRAGLTLSANYTYSRAQSDMGEGARTACFGCGLWPANPSYDYGNGDLDVRHRFAFAANYELPFGKSLKGAAAQLAKGWQLNGIYLFSTGLPLIVVNSSNPQSNLGVAGGGLATNISGDRPNRLSGSSSFEQSIDHWFDLSAFTLQPFGHAGNEGRNPFYAPSQRRLDMSVFKDFPIRESLKLQFRLETFNITNTPSFAWPTYTISGWTSTTAGSATPTQAGNFGKITATSAFYTPRDVQFALKLLF
jgi:outer membrane receptor protein involved in Fe transport